MVNRTQLMLDAVFSALADPTRRGILASLTVGALPVTELSQPYDMSLPGFMKHLRILEDAGLVRREKAGRVVSCTLDASALRDASHWLERYRAFWEGSLDALAQYLEEQPTAWHSKSTAVRAASSAKASSGQTSRTSGVHAPRKSARKGRRRKSGDS